MKLPTKSIQLPTKFARNELFLGKARVPRASLAVQSSQFTVGCSKGWSSFGSHGRDGYGHEDVEHGALSSRPNRVGGAGGLASTFLAAVEADVEADGPVDGFDDFTHGGFTAAGKNSEATEFATMGRDEVSVSEGLQDLGEEAFGGVGGVGEVGEERARFARECSEVDHDANSVICGARELHGGIAFLRREGCWGMRFHACSSCEIWTIRVQFCELRAGYPVKSHANVSVVTDPWSGGRLILTVSIELEKKGPEFHGVRFPSVRGAIEKRRMVS